MPRSTWSSDMRRTGMKQWIALVLVVLLALAAYVIAGPYMTVRAIRTAVKQQDAAALSRQVDFPALRTSLKAQLADRLLRKAGPDLQSNPFAAFGLSIANGVIGGGVGLRAISAPGNRRATGHRAGCRPWS